MKKLFRELLKLPRVRRRTVMVVITELEQPKAHAAPQDDAPPDKPHQQEGR